MATIYDQASLVMIPSGYKDDKLYSVKPTDGSGDFTFSRDGSGASPATRVNASGYIEKGRENLLLQSNTFDTTWYDSGITETSGNSGYDGSNDAWEITRNGAFNYKAQDVTTSGVQTFSAYAKRSSFDFLLIRFQRTSTSYGGAYFDLASGVVGSTDGSGVIDSNIESVGGDWYRISITFNESLLRVLYYPVPSDGGVSVGGSGSVFIQDAQLEQGLISTSYIETTTAPVSAGLLGDMPRLDYSGGATCPSLLLEPSRVNLITQSEYTVSYGKNETPVITDNAHISPEGVQNATNLNIDSVSEGFFVFPTSVTSGTSYTISVFIKYIDGSETIRFGHAGAGFGGDNNNVFNVSTGVVVSESGGTCSVEDYGNGWYRLIATRTASASSTGGLILYGNADTNSNFAVYGLQIEEGSYPTSYIPTYGSASTRGADSCSKTGITSLIGQSEGTFFFEIGDKTTESISIFEAGQGSSQYRFFVYTDTSKKLKVLVVDNFSVQVSYTSSVDVESNAKIAVAYAANDYAIYLNGSLLSTDTSASVPPMSQLAVGSDRGAIVTATNNTKQALLFKTRLTNAELASLTTL